MLTAICLLEAAALVAAGITIGSLAAALRSKDRAHARRENELLDRLLHVIGKPWTPAPADEPRPVEPADENGWPEWSASPEQHPVF